jgi:hypothetical protein
MVVDPAVELVEVLVPEPVLALVVLVVAVVES